MTKTAIVCAILISLVSGIAYATQDTDLAVHLSDAFDQLRKEDNEHRKATNVNTNEIKELKQKVAANQATPSAAAPAPAKIDYTRYDLATRDCAGSDSWTPTSSTKERDAIAFNSQTVEGFKQFRSDCLRKQDAAGFAADARRAQKRDQRVAAVVTPPPAPGAIQDDEPEVTTADLNDDRDGPAVLQQASYGGQPLYGRLSNGRPAYSHSARPKCPSTFRFDPREKSCVRHTDVVGPSPYNQAVPYCVPGTSRRLEVRSPTGGRRVVEQVCNRH